MISLSRSRYAVVVRAIQLPFLTWAIARVLSGPIAHRDGAGTLAGVAGYLAFAAFTELCFVFRYRFALRLGEAVVHDLRDAVYAHLLRMPLGFFQRASVGGFGARRTSLPLTGNASSNTVIVSPFSLVKPTPISHCPAVATSW